MGGYEARKLNKKEKLRFDKKRVFVELSNTQKRHPTGTDLKFDRKGRWKPSR